MSRSKNRVYAAIIILFCASFSSLGAANDLLIPDAHYVNMGSSFAAGSGIAPLDYKSGQCGRSLVNYASLLAKSLDLRLTDTSCGGAKSIHLLEPWGSLPAQLEAVTSKTKLVTITVGGNDLNYVRNVFAAGCVKNEAAQGAKFSAKPEEDKEVDRFSMPCIEQKSVDKAAYSKLEKNLAALSSRLRVIAPLAKIIFIHYTSLIPNKHCDVAQLTDKDIKQLKILNKRLIDITSGVAYSAGVYQLRVDQLSENHTPCDEIPWSIGSKATASNSNGIPWHPNSKGHEEIAALLHEFLTK